MWSKEAISLVEGALDHGVVDVVLRAIVVVLAAGDHDPHGGVLVAHPVVGQPGVNTAKYTQNRSCWWKRLNKIKKIEKLI